jgi:putative ABC transport system ATP-binding protein
MTDIITVKNLKKSFHDGEKELVVLKGLDLVVKKGEFLSITGRSGSGKSTLLYQLGLLDNPDSGEINIDGKEITGLSNEARTEMRLKELGYIFQDYALVPELTALENVLVPLMMHGFSKSMANEKASRSLEKMGLGDRLDHLPNQLSGGEQQRVAIARAIAHDPKIIFADEPTANLDSETAEVVMQNFLDLHKEGQTIIMVTHEPEYAEKTDRVVQLLDGVIVSEVVNK